MNQSSHARPLSDRERAVAQRILDATRTSDVDRLKNQLSVATVEAASNPTFLDLTIPRTVPHAKIEDGPLSVQALIRGTDAQQVEGEIILWVQDGYLSALELAWYTDEPPVEWPSTDRLVTS